MPRIPSTVASCSSVSARDSARASQASAVRRRPAWTSMKPSSPNAVTAVAASPARVANSMALCRTRVPSSSRPRVACTRALPKAVRVRPCRAGSRSRPASVTARRRVCRPASTAPATMAARPASSWLSAAARPPTNGVVPGGQVGRRRLAQGGEGRQPELAPQQVLADRELPLHRPAVPAHGQAAQQQLVVGLVQRVRARPAGRRRAAPRPAGRGPSGRSRSGAAGPRSGRPPGAARRPATTRTPRPRRCRRRRAGRRRCAAGRGRAGQRCPVSRCPGVRGDGLGRARRVGRPVELEHVDPHVVAGHPGQRVTAQGLGVGEHSAELGERPAHRAQRVVGLGEEQLGQVAAGRRPIGQQEIGQHGPGLAAARRAHRSTRRAPGSAGPGGGSSGRAARPRRP